MELRYQALGLWNVTDASQLLNFLKPGTVANVATLYGLETAVPASAPASDPPADGEEDAAGGPEAVTFLVMELVAGDELGERIARGPLPVADAAPIALQIAAALEAAHEAGIVHRDLKPANIKITDDGTEGSGEMFFSAADGGRRGTRGELLDATTGITAAPARRRPCEEVAAELAARRALLAALRCGRRAVALRAAHVAPVSEL